jgi:hypothetical protein
MLFCSSSWASLGAATGGRGAAIGGRGTAIGGRGAAGGCCSTIGHAAGMYNKSPLFLNS